ncbi:filamentous hemagglutinin family protein [Sphingomonas kyeonggiensis]|uniref:Filamentous hemagglutinin family protein n=1 Tax=Sphingomonas kyeonggiensis TaxID=1268553 RepID=A0A7W7NSZ4_9SPHN|nr:YDG domain-containing protein [Sphingomonas kyeonggiensis]MBB4840785.1 filamentous hemagglutinin family protein [Sphingomonas kyeonggiensis]
MSAPRRRSNRRLFTTSAFGALALAAVWAAPAQAQLVQGATPAQSNGTTPTIDQSVPNTTTVTLGGSRTVIDWDKFDINSGDTANFVFANRSDIVLNRVGGAGSTINGNLNGTIGSTGGAVGGNIWIYNANGVVIGANARISTGGLLVTTAGLDRATDGSAGGFLDGSSTSFGFTGAGTGNITVQNGAQITSHGGAIALVAPVVTTEAGSSISAQDGGNVLVGSASKYQISFRQTATDDMDLLSFEVASGADGAGTSGSDAISLGGDISGNRVFVAAVSKSGLVASVMNTGTITASDATMDETGAIVLGANHNIVNGAAAAAPVSGTGEGHVTTIGGAIAGPKVDFVASENVLLRGDVGETGATVNLHSDNTDIRQYAGVITADTVTASAHTGINFNSFDANKVDKLGALTTDGGNLTYLGDEDGVILTGAISAPGRVTLGVRGFMDTTTGSITASSLELFLGGGGSFKVNGDANLGSGMSNGAVTVHATGGITLSNEFAMNLGSQLSLTADSGAIRETGGFISGGGAVVANAAGEIDLRGANSFTSLTANSADGENITVNATGNLDFKVNTFSSARFTVGGDATSSGTNALIAGGLHVTAGGAINLSSDGGDAAFGDLQANGNITLAMDGVLRLGGVMQANGGTASFTSRSGAIQQSSGSITASAIIFDADSTITQTNGAFVQTGGLSLTSGGTATLGSANSFTSLQDLHVGGDLTLRNAGTINLTPVSSGGYTAGGQLNLTSDNGDIISPNAIAASRITASAWGSIGLSGALDSLGAVTAGGMIGITSNRALSVTGNVVAGTNISLSGTSIGQGAGTTISGNDVTLNATAGAIDQHASASVNTSNYLEAHATTDLLLRGANNLGYQDPYLTSGAGKDVTIRSIGDFRYNSYGITVGTLTLISDAGSIRQGSGIYAGTLIAQAATGLRLDGGGVGNTVTTVGGLSTTSGDIMFVEGDGFDIAGDISAPGLVQLGTSGAINTNSGHLSAGTLEVTALGGASFDVTGNIKLGDISTGGGNFYLGSNGNIELTGAIATGASNLILSTSNGSITSNGGTISAWLTMADATGAISLVGSGYANFWANSSGGGAIHLSGNNDVGFQAVTNGALTVDAGGQAYNSGDVVANTVSITAGTGISLVNTGVTIDIDSFSHLAAGDGLVSIDIAGDINLDGDVTAGGTGNTVSLRSGGSILQNSGTITGDIIKLSGAAAITQASGATLDGGALSITSSGNVALGEANAFTSIADLSVGGDLTLRNLGSIDLDPTTGGGATVVGALTVTSDTGDISAGNIVTTSKLTATALNGSILLGGGGHLIGSLGTLTASGDIEIGTDLPGFALTGDITATNVTLLAMNGGITQNAGTRITAGTLYATANNNITLDQANAITTVGGLNANLFTSGHNITFRNDGNIILNGRVDATGGTLRLTSNTGGITQNTGAGIYLRANQLFLSAAGYTELGSTNNNVAAIGGITNTDYDTQYQDADGFDVAGNLTAGAGGIILRAGGSGAITQSAGIISAGAFGAQGDTVTFTRANQFARLLQTQGNSVTINTVGDLQIWQGLTGNTISLTSGGAITQDGSSYVYAYNTLNLSAVTGIDLPGVLYGGNNIIALGTVTNTTSGGIRIFTNNGGYGTTLAGNITATGQTVTIADQLGAINQTGGVITADTLNLSATAGISATSANAITNLGTLSAGGAIAFTNGGDLNISQSIDATGNSLTLTSNSGALTQGAGTTLTAATMALDASTTISQGTGASLHTTDLSLTSGGTTTLGGANDFTKITGLDIGGDLTLHNLGLIDLSPGFASYSYRGGGALTLISDTSGIFSTNSGISTSRLTASGVGSVNLSGAIASVGNVSANSVFLWTFNGDMTLTGNITGYNVGLGSENGSLTQTGGIIDAARLNVTTDGAILLTGANQVDVFGGLNTDKDSSGTYHDITIRNVGDIVFDYLVRGAGATVDLTSDTGGISQTSINGGYITAGTLKANAAGDIVLDQAGNDFDHLGAIRSTGGNVTLVDADAFDLTGQVRAAGALSLTSGGAISTGTGGLVIAGGLLNVSATSANMVAGGNIQLGTVTTNGNFAIDTDGNLTVAGLLNTNGGDATLKANFGTIGHGPSGTISANKVTATARDNITLDSTGNAIIWASSSNGGDINLTGNADVFFKIDTTGDLTVDAGGIAGNNDSVIANSVGINAASGVYLSDQTVTINVGSYRYLTSSAGSIDIENQADINLDGDVTAGGGTNYVRLNSSGGSLLQYSGTISGYSVELDAAQSVTQDASAKVVAGDYGLSFRATDVSLLGANEIPSISIYTVTHDLTLRAVGTIDMSGSANQAGSNHYTTLISDTGNIIGGPIDADRLSATATNGSLTFTYGNNRIRSLGDLTAKSTGGTDINIFTDSTMGLTGNITGGGVILHATQGINQTAGVITADRFAAGTSGNLLLGGANNFGTLTEVGHGNGATVTIRNLGSILLPTTSTPFGTLTLTSDTGSIGQTDAITAATLIANAATGINLTYANNFTALDGLITAAGDIRISDTNGFAIEGDITAPGTVALASGGNITTGTTTVGIVTTPHGKIDADTLTVSATNATVYTAGDIKLGASSVTSGFTLVGDGSIDLTATSNFFAASLIANTGSITQSGGILTGNTVLTGAAGSITLARNNSLSSFGGTSQGGGTVTFNNAGTSTLDLTVSTTGNAVVTTAGGVLGSYIRAGDLSLTAGGAIDLTFNSDVNSVSKLVTTSGNVLLTDANSFQISGDVTAGSGTLGTVDLRASAGGISQFDGTITGNDVHLTGSGNLSQVGNARIVANTIALSGYAITFNGANSFNSTGSSVSTATNGGLILRNAGSIDLDALGGYTSGSTLALTSDNGSITSTGAIAASSLSAVAEHGAVSFGNAANSFIYLGAVSASGDATITTSSTSLSLLNTIAVGGRLTLGAQGAITQSNGTLTAISLYATAGGATGAITLGAANDVATLGALTADGDVSFHDINGFQIAGNVRGDHVTLIADAGAIRQNSGTVIANHLTASAVDGLVLSQIGNQIHTIDGLTNSSNASNVGIAIASDVDMHLAGDVTAPGQYVYFFVGNGALVQDSGTITGGYLRLRLMNGSATLGAGNALDNLDSIWIDGGDFTANSNLSTGVLGLNGNILVSGTTTITNAAGITQGPGGVINTYDLNLNTAGTLDMGNVINIVGGQANIAMGSGSFLSYGDLNLRLNATGAATITSGGNINFTGAGSSSADTLTLSAVNGIYSGAGAGGQIAANHLGTITNSGSGGIALNLLGNVTLEGDITATGQTVSITAEDGLSQATGNVITANRLDVATTAPNASVVLDNANVVGTFGLNVTGDATLRSTLATTIASGMSVGGSLTVNSPGDIVMAGGSVGGTLALHAGGAVNGTGYVSADRLTGSAQDYFYLNFTNLNTLDTVESGSNVQINASSSNLNIVGDITAAGGIELSGYALNQSAGTITTGANSGIGLSTDGAITQTGGRIIAKYISAIGGDISLIGANQVGAIGNYLSSGGTSIAFRNQGSIEANSDFRFYNGRGALTLISDTGAITQSVAVDATSVTLSAATGIDFSNAGNTIDAVGGLSNSTSGGIVFATTRDLALNGNVAAAGQNVSLSGTRSITQSSGGITATNFRANANLGLALTSATNNVVNVTGLASAVSGGIAYTDADSFNITGDINALNGQTLSLATIGATASVNQTGGIVTSGRLNLSGGQVYDLRGSGGTYNHITGIGDISAAAQIYSQDSLNLTGTISSPYLELWSQGDVTQGAGKIVYTAGNFLEVRAGNISLTSATNQLGDVSGLITWASGNIDVVSDGNTRFGDVVGGNVSLTVTNGSIGSLGDYLDVDTLSASASGGIGLGGRIGEIGNITAGGDAAFRSSSSFDLSGNINIGTGRLSLSSDASITQFGGSVTAGGLEVDAVNLINLQGSANTIGTIYGLTTQSGDITYTGTSGIVLAGNITAGNAGDVRLSAGAGSITQNAGIITGRILNANATGDITLTGENQLVQLGGLSTSGAISYTGHGDYGLAGSLVGSSVTLNSTTGAITQSVGAILTASLSAHASTGLDLFGANNFDALGDLSTTTGNLRLRNYGELILSNLSVGGDLTLLSDSRIIGQNLGTTMTVGGTATLTAYAGINLNRANSIARFGEVRNVGALGSITLTNAGDLVLTEDISAPTQMVLLYSNNGAIVQQGGVITTGNMVAHANGNITLDSANDIEPLVTSELVSTSGGISFHSANAILLGPVSAAGQLSLTSDSGGIAQTVAISAGSLSATSLDGDIVLDQANTIGAVGNVATDGSFTFNTAGNLSLTGTITAPTLVKLTAGGNITQIAATGVIETSQLHATSGGTAANGISLLGHNDVAQAILNSSGKDLRFRNTGDFELGNISAAGHIVEMISDGGAVTQLAGTSILAGTFSATGTNVVLDNTGNQISRIGLIATGSDLSLRNGVALQIDAIDAGSHNVTINNGGDISGGNITANLLTVNPIGGGVFLNTANHVNSIGGFNGYQFEFVNDGSFTIAGAIQNGMFQTFLTSQNGSISMAGGAVNSGGVTLQAATGISITGNLSYVYGATTITGNVSILSSLLDIQGDITGDTVTLGGTANGGFVRQTSGVITANLLNASGYGSVTLDGAANHIAALGTLSSSFGDVIIKSLDAVALTGNIDTSSYLSLDAGGAVDQTGGRINAGWLYVNAAGDVTLDAANLVNSGGDVWLGGDNVSFVNDGTFTIAGVDAGTTGAIDLTSLNGNIWQSNAMNGGSLTASAHGSLSLNQGNAIDSVGALSAGTELTYNGATAYQLIDDITAGTTVSLNGGSITQTGGKITAQTLEVNAANANLQSYNAVGRLGTITAGSFVFINSGDIELWGTVNTSTLSLLSLTGGVSNPGGLFATDHLNVMAADNIQLLGGTFNYIDYLKSQGGDITLTTSSNVLGATLISAENGTVDLTVGRITADAVAASLLNVDAGSGDIELLGNNEIGRLGYLSGDNISLAVGQTAITGYINANNSIAFVRSGLATDFALGMGSNGALRAQMISLSNTGSAGTATLSSITTLASQLELNFNFNGNASVTTSVGGIYLNNAVVDGDLYLRAYNGITASGAHSDISGTISAQNITGDISLNFGTDTVGHFGDILTGSGYIGLGAASVDLTGVVQAGGGGGVFLSAANGSVTQASGSTITAANIQGMATGDFLLTGANHISALGTITATNGDIAVATDRSLTIAGDVTTDRNHSISLISTLASGPAIQNSGTGVLHTGTLNIQAIGDVVLTNQDILRLGLIDPTLFSFSQAADFDITADIVADAVQLTSTGGQITQSGGVITTSAATLSAQTGISLLGNNRFGTLSLSTMAGDIGINNVGDLVLTALNSPGNANVTVTGGGSLTIGSPTVTAAGDLSLEADSIIVISGAIAADGDVSVTSHNGAVSLFTVEAGDDIAVTSGAANSLWISAASIGSSGNDSEADGHNMVFNGGSVALGALSPASIAANNSLLFNGQTGSATINAGPGGATVNLNSMDHAISMRTPAAIQAQVNTGDLLLGDVEGGDASLRSVLGSVNATGVNVNGNYTLASHTGFNAAALSPCGCGILNLSITQDTGNLFLPTSIGAFGNIQITVSGGALDAAAGVQLGAVGDVEVHAGNIGIGGVSGGNVTLVANAGTIDVRDFLLVANDYTLTGRNFAGAALAPGGTRGGSWALTATGPLDMGGNTLEYVGDIDFSVAGLFSNGTIQSLSGAVTGTANSADVYRLIAATDLDVSTTSGSFTIFRAAATSGNATLRSSQALSVTGSIEAGADASVSAQFGAATVGSASAGDDISVYSLFGNATLRQATLTGTTGGLSVQSVIGAAKLGADDSASITGDHYFERAAGSTGTVSILGSIGARVYLDHSAALDLVQANTAWVEVQHGNLSIDTLAALAGDATAITGAGSIFVNSARGGVLLLEASGGNLTLGGAGITANGIHLVADSTVDTTAISNLSGQYIEIVGSTIRAASLSSSGDADLSSTNGGITLDNLTVSGVAFVSAFGDLAMNQISVGGLSDFVAGGEATVRGAIAGNGFTLTGQGNVTLGADAGTLAAAGNDIQVGGTLGGCGCFTGGATVISLGGNVSVNLTSATGVFDRITADAGDVSIANASGDLGINLLRGHNILVSTPGLLSIMDAQSSGGSYALTAADFGTFTLSPSLFGGATRLGDVTIIDTDGDLNSTGSFNSSGDIRVEARGGAITGGLALIAAGDVTAIGQGVALQWAEGRDVTIDAGTGTVAISNTLSVGRDYTVTAGHFSGNALTVGGMKAGSLAIIDTAGDFDFGATDLAFDGAIDIDASHGLLAIGNLQAGNAITLNAGSNLTLASAALTSTGTNSFSLVAGGDLQFGAANAASVAGTNVFSNAGSLAGGRSIQADGNLAINLQQADSLGAIEGGTVQIAVAAGDFSAGNIDAVGALSVQGPAGTLTLGDLTTSAGHINVSGQGNTTLGNVSGHFVVNLGTSLGNLSVGTVTGGDVSFSVAGGIDAASISASTLGVVAMGGNVNLDNGGTGSQVGSLGSVTVGNGNFALRNLQGLSLDGVVEVSGVLDLQVTGGLTQNAWYIVADRLQGNVTGAATLGGDNRIGTLAAFSANGLRLNNATALAIDGLVQGNGGAVTIASHGGLEISSNGSIVSAASGDAIVLASDGRFTNLAGAGALSASNGRWLVYTQAGGNPGISDPLNDFGGLAGTSYYGDAYNFATGGFATAPNAGNRFVYGYRPVLTVTPSSLHLVYDGTTPNVTTTITGLVNGDSAANAWTGQAAITGVGSDAGTYPAYASLGTLSSEMGYTFTFVPGTVVIDPRVISAILTANSKTYDGTLGATGTLGLSGLIAGDTVSANSTGMAFDGKNAGTHLVTANGITLSGADAGNYVLSASSTTALAEILAKAITATLTANGKTYDGTIAATGSLGLGGLIGNDQVSAAGSYAFDSKNAGTGRTVTASGITLSGTDAGNYVLTDTSATALADILAKAITATLTANGKTYDGTTAATGSLSLGGLVGNDQVSATGSYAFDSKNAGTGRTVTASGIGLSGVDAGNYVLTGTSATALADILAKAITATLSANGKTYDGTTAATGTLGLNGVVAGDTVSATSAGMAFDSKNAGTGRTVTASGIGLSGGDAGNYVLTGTTATALANILAKAITATLAANGRVYDGTTAATGTLGLSGLIGGDTVGVTAADMAFDSKNAGTRTATATGLALNGADAANYTISGTASGSAVISLKAIGATATADSRTYDGTTTATGRIALTGLISGDTVTGTASYRFADANAGTGRTVQVSGLSLSGADAANYTVTLSGTPVTADITRRAVTVTVADMTKLLGQPDPAFTYAVTGGSVVSGDSFSGALARAAGEQVGRYAIGQGTLALSANYLLTVIPGTLAITLTQSGADASDALKTLRVGVAPGFSLDQNPSRNLEGDDQGEDESDGDK